MSSKLSKISGLVVSTTTEVTEVEAPSPEEIIAGGLPDYSSSIGVQIGGAQYRGMTANIVNGRLMYCVNIGSTYYCFYSRRDAADYASQELEEKPMAYAPLFTPTVFSRGKKTYYLDQYGNSQPFPNAL